MHAVEAVRFLEEVGGRLRRAANLRQLRDPMRRNGQLPERLDAGGGDRSVRAHGAQRRHRAFVVAPRETDLVLLESGIEDLRFGYVRHGFTAFRSRGATETRSRWIDVL